MTLITLTTDFGAADAYVAAVKGVILGINPAARLVDISHSVHPQDIFAAAFLLGSVYGCFPSGTVHVVVVDPGVGSERRAIAVRSAETTFVAPDNGVLSYVLSPKPGDTPGRKWPPRVEDIALPAGLAAYSLTNPDYWRRPVSATFHGRDIFAPAAAHLSLGVPIDRMGQRLQTIKAFELPCAFRDGDRLVGRVVYIDRFGNMATDIRPEQLLTEEPLFRVRGRRIRGLSHSYAEAKDMLAIVGSSGLVEVSRRNGNAAEALGARVGDRVTAV